MGMRWWGPGPDDFTRLVRFHSIRPVVVADLGRPVQRRMLRSRMASDSLIASRLMARGRGAEGFIVLAPHRIPPSLLGWMKKRGPVTAWLGDEPVGARAVRFPMSAFTRVACADPRWVPGSAWLPWPHLVPQPLTERISEGTSDTFVMVGTAYPDRVELARSVHRTGRLSMCVGSGWPDDLPAVPPMGRVETLAWLKGREVTVLNVPHRQMLRTYNPFFFDLAAAGIPQIVMAPPGPFRSALDVADRRVRPKELRDARVAPSVTRQLQAEVLAHHSVDTRLETLL
ncbi:hypothetical protein ACIPSA_16475 [Streptomyces sp. NPDC086549]|uniref:hypothetical protein n=1 Tax=Streptomyces sp. NPDC086549 TaxID=3365752 RepID=UPI0037FBD8BF